MTQGKMPTPRLKKISWLLRKGRVNEALRLARKEDVLGLSRIAERFRKAGAYDVALSVAERMTELAPENATAWFNKGSALAELNRHADALDAFDRVLKLDPANVQAIHDIGVAYSKLGRFEAALKSLEDLLQLQPGNAMALHNKGAVLADLGRYNEALQVLGEAIALDPNNAKAWYNKGITLVRIGDYRGALIAFDMATEINPNFTAAWFNKGTTLAELGGHKEALEANDVVITLDPKNPKPWHNKGVTFDSLNRYQEALDAYDGALALDPKFTPAAINRGVVLSRLGHYQKALQAHNDVIETSPENPKAWFNRGVELLNMFSYEEAARSFDKARDLFSALGAHKEAQIAAEAADSARNGLLLVEKLSCLDREFMSSLSSRTLQELRDKARLSAGSVTSLTREFGGLRIPMDALRLLESKAACFAALSDSLCFKEVDLDALEKARAVFREFNLLKFFSAVNAIDTFLHALKKYKTLHEIPLAEEDGLLITLNTVQALDGALSAEVEGAFRIPPLLAGPAGLEERVEIRPIHIADRDFGKEWVKVCLVQLDFIVTKPPPRLEDSCKEDVRRKVFEALDVAMAESADIICFPELSFTEEWVEEVKNRQLDMVVVCGSYYNEYNQNVCQIIINCEPWQYEKCYPSIFEQQTGKVMNPGRFVPLFQTKWGRIAVLNCIDFNQMRDRFSRIPIDIILNPRFDIARDHAFLSRANDMMHTPEEDKNHLFVLVCNAAEAKFKEVTGGGGTAIISYQERYALPNFEGVGLYPKDSVKYNICQARGEMIITASLRLGPITKHRAEIGNLYRRKGNAWVEMKDKRIWPENLE